MIDSIVFPKSEKEHNNQLDLFVLTTETKLHHTVDSAYEILSEHNKCEQEMKLRQS